MANGEGQRLLAGVDVGGSKLVTALGHERGDGIDIVSQRRRDHWTAGDWRADLDIIAGEIEALLADASADPVAIGVCAPGPLDARRVLFAPNLKGWTEVPVVDTLERRLGRPVRLENDANAAALAEWRFGAGRGVRNLAFLTMSTGVGGGLILDGRLYRGSRVFAGELGHAPIVDGGRKCACGLHGCLEAYTGGAALAGRIREAVAAGQATAITELAGGEPDAIDAELWVRALRAGDAYARALGEEYLDHLAQGLAILLATLDLDRVVLGTIIRENADLFLGPLTERVRARTRAELHDAELVVGALGRELPAYAALSAALER